MNWFEVDRAGLAKLLERRGKEFALFELISNAWDTNAQEVKVTFEALPGVAKAKLVVEDDHPDGFTDLSHSFTLFAESEKKTKSEKRGRFNLGEKLVLSLCDHARITSTKGTIIFGPSGRTKSKQATESGSRVEMQVRMTHAEVTEALAAMRTLIPPRTTVLNGETLPHRTPLAEFIVELPTRSRTLMATSNDRGARLRWRCTTRFPERPLRSTKWASRWSRPETAGTSTFSRRCR